MDMGRLMSFATMMGAGKKEGKAPEKRDTILSYKSFMDSTASLTAEEKAVMSKASMHMNVDEENSIMEFTITYPYSNEKEFEIIQKVMSKKETSNAISSAVGSMFGKSDDLNKMPDDKKPGMPTDGFVYSLTKNSLSKKVKESSKTATPTGSEDMPAEFKEMLKMNYTTTINLPKPVKNWKGNNGTLSADKKQLKFNKNIDMDSKLTPADFDFSIDF